MEIPSSLKLLAVDGPRTSHKTGKDYMFADAESPADPTQCKFSTIRWRCLSQRVAFPPSWKVGATVPVQILSFNLRDGVGEFDVPAGR